MRFLVSEVPLCGTWGLWLRISASGLRVRRMRKVLASLDTPAQVPGTGTEVFEVSCVGFRVSD
jgi:hypothetical protein